MERKCSLVLLHLLRSDPGLWDFLTARFRAATRGTRREQILNAKQNPQRNTRIHTVLNSGLNRLTWISNTAQSQKKAFHRKVLGTKPGYCRLIWATWKPYSPHISHPDAAQRQLILSQRCQACCTLDSEFHRVLPLLSGGCCHYESMTKTIFFFLNCEARFPGSQCSSHLLHSDNKWLIEELSLTVLRWF